MTLLSTAVQGDVNDKRVLVLSGVEDLATATAVEAHIWRDGETAETLTAAILDPVARTVQINLGGAAGWLSDAAADEYYLETEITFAGGEILTWPSGVPDILPVRAEGA